MNGSAVRAQCYANAKVWISIDIPRDEIHGKEKKGSRSCPFFFDQRCIAVNPTPNLSAVCKACNLLRVDLGFAFQILHEAGYLLLLRALAQIVFDFVELRHFHVA